MNNIKKIKYQSKNAELEIKSTGDLENKNTGEQEDIELIECLELESKPNLPLRDGPKIAFQGSKGKEPVRLHLI